MNKPDNTPRVNNPRAVAIMAGILALLLAFSLTFCWSSVVGEPDWPGMTDKEMFLAIVPIAVVTNLYLFYIAAAIAVFVKRKMTLPVLIVLLLLAGAVDIKITLSAMGAVDELQIRDLESARKYRRLMRRAEAKFPVATNTPLVLSVCSKTA